jgi:virulence factor Mce-like protein
MRRAIVIAGASVLLVAAVVWVAASRDGDGYRVRAIFDNAGHVTPGEDVKVAGANVGKVESLSVTRDDKAAITMRIDVDGFSPFHTDARCTVRQQSLIAEKFVDCNPGSDAAPELPQVPEGDPGAGSHLLPLARTSSPVDLDLVNSIFRLPVRQRLTLIVNELGTGVSGRGRDLNEAIHRANPALRETDKVLAVLASQDRSLARLVRDSDRVVAPLARRRRQAAHLVDAAATTSQATASQSGDLATSVRLLPQFLAELQPTLQSLGQFAEASDPVLAELSRGAPQIDQLVRRITPFAQAGTPALVALGNATQVGLPALKQSEPVLRTLASASANARPVAADLDAITRSLNATGGVREVLNWIYFQTTAVNGFDDVSHYLRAGLLTNFCSAYSLEPTPGCSARFTGGAAVPEAGAHERRSSPAPEPAPANPPVRDTSTTNPAADTMLRYLLDP